MVSAESAPAQPLAGVMLDDDTIQKERIFSGEIVSDEMIRGDYGPQWHFAVKPLEYTLDTKTGAHHEYVGVDKRGPRTKFGVIVGSALLVVGKGSTIGKGELVGRQFNFLEKDFSFGRDRDTKEPIVRTFMLFHSELSDDDKARISAAGTIVSKMPTSEFTDEQAEAIIALVAGQSEASISSIAARSKLEATLKASVMSGKAIPALVASGKLVQVDGKLERPQPDPA